MRMRKKRRGAERMEALSALSINRENIKSEYNEIFSNNNPLRVEIGCGKGDFVCALSERDTEYNYIAMEKVADVIMLATEKYASRRDLGFLTPHGEWETPEGEKYNGVRWDIPFNMRGNVRFMNDDASDIDEIFPSESIDTVFANFSDPWPKKGNSNRRLTHPDFLKKYLKILKPGGLFAFKTDNDDLFDFSVEAINAENGFEVTYITYDLHSSDRADNNIMTEYERNFSSQGVKIKFIEAKKI